MMREGCRKIIGAIVLSAAVFAMTGAGFSAQAAEALPQVLLNAQSDWYGSGAPDYKRLYTGSYETAYLDSESAEAYPLLDQALRAWSDQKMEEKEEYISLMHETADTYLEEDSAMLPLMSESSLYVRRADEKVVSILSYDYSYEGGVHGMYGYGGYCFDAQTGERITLDRVLANPAGLPSVLSGILRETYPEINFFSLDESLEEAGAVDDAEGWDWTLDPDGITFYFDPYYLASYADGALEAFISFQGHEDLFTGEFTAQTGAWAIEVPPYFSQKFRKSDGSWHTLTVTENVSEYDYESYDSINIDIDGAAVKGPQQWFYESDYYLVHAANGANYLYVRYLAENDYSFIDVYDLYKTPYRVGEVFGDFSAGSFPEEPEDGGWRLAFTHPEMFSLNSIIQYLSTCSGEREYVLGSDGMPDAQTPYYTFSYPRTLKVKTDLSLPEVVYADDRAEGTAAGTVTVKTGEKVTFWRTDGETYMDLKREDGSAVRCVVETGPWPFRINGIALEEAFDGIVFAG